MNEEDIVKAARDRMAESVDADQENRERAYEDLKFLTGDQWPQDVREEREADGKITLTINRLPQFVRQVTGDIRKMNPAINILPGDTETSEDTADIVEGLVRYIQYKSDASSVYEQTAEMAAAASIGWFRALTDYESDTSFNQEILIKRIRSPFSVYCDPAAEEATRSDARYVFITETMPQADFKEEYPNARAIDVEHDGLTDGLRHWAKDGHIVVAEYYWKEPVTREIALLEDGTTREFVKGESDEGVVQTRTVNTHRLMWAKVTGHEVLEGPIEQPSRDIPVFAVTGEEWDLGDKVYRSSVNRFAKDSQMMYNFMSSASAEYVALQPKAPYIGTVKQFEGLEGLWKEANNKNQAFLPYKPDEKAPGAPQRAAPPISSSGIANEIAKAGEDMKATTGIYDAGLGNRSNESSGVAIRQRQMESDVATSIYSDNMAKAIAQCGRVIVQMIPKIYDTRRAQTIIGKDDQQEVVTINDAIFEDGQQVTVNDLTIGTYEVRVDVGPNYSTLRQETADSMMQFAEKFPALGAAVADLIADAQEWPNRDQFVERIRKTLPPGMRDQQNLTPEEQQMAMQAAQQAEQQAQLQAAAQQIEMRKASAEVAEAEADAQKADFEAQEQGLNLMVQTGQLNAEISRLIQQEVARALFVERNARMGII